MEQQELDAHPTHSIRLIDLDDLIKAIDFMKMLVIQYSISDDMANIIQLVVDEIYVNFCTHGKESGGNYQDINFTITPNIIEIVFQDNGKEFNPLSYIKSDAPHTSIEEHPVGGLGIHLVKHFADSLDYKYENNFNILIFRKKL